MTEPESARFAASPSVVMAVVVTWHPEPERLARLCAALRPQTERVVVVDNGSAAHELAGVHAARSDGDGTLELIELGHNTGVAAAQNRGIERALAAGASHVLLMDQDSMPAPDMVMRLLETLATPAARPAAAVGPRLFDPRTGTSLAYLKKTGARFRSLPAPENAAAPLEVDHLIASGCLIPAERLRRIGLMDETLFVDAVDTEWCMRARAAGFCLLAETRTVLEHTLGARSVHLRGRTLAFHGPQRQYYIFRNNLLLCRRPYVDRAWRRLMSKALPLRFLFHALASLIPGAGQGGSLPAMLSGIFDAWRGRSGARRGIGDDPPKP
ncbi:MAG: glycosyltransferase family 2 protein [Azoarcus sp.]|jgi:rhamnosyltransferase|nr:glycosyltransferase family 2 protein [Azoarcus sp.]